MIEMYDLIFGKKKHPYIAIKKLFSFRFGEKRVAFLHFFANSFFNFGKETHEECPFQQITNGIFIKMRDIFC
jgi:hypothetical protein